MLKFAIPSIDRKLCVHFGRCEEFAIIDVHPVRSSPAKQDAPDKYREISNRVENNKITNTQFVKPPHHEPGVFPKWLAEQGITHIISTGMGRRAQALFEQNNIEVCVGVNAETPRKLVEQYLNNKLQTGQNLCDH